jgi:hypothetical protein
LEQSQLLEVKSPCRYLVEPSRLDSKFEERMWPGGTRYELVVIHWESIKLFSINVRLFSVLTPEISS